MSQSYYVNEAEKVMDAIDRLRGELSYSAKQRPHTADRLGILDEGLSRGSDTIHNAALAYKLYKPRGKKRR